MGPKRRQKKVRLIGVPVDLGATRLGVEVGPGAIRSLGLVRILRSFGTEVDDVGDLTVHRAEELSVIDPKAKFLPEIAKISRKLVALVSDSLKEGYFPVCMGGDHSLSIGSIAGVASVFPRLGLLWIDAHPDANTPESTPSGNIHGMPLAIALGFGPRQLTRIGGVTPKLKPENVCLVAAKDMDPAEEEFLDTNGIRFFTMRDIDRMGIARVMEQAMGVVSKETDAVHVSFDLDAVDGLYAPGVGIHNRGGLTYREVRYLVDELGTGGLVSSLDIVELNPKIDIQGLTASLAIEIICGVLGLNYSDYTTYLQSNRI